MKTAHIARIAEFSRFVSGAHHAHTTMHDAHDAHALDPVRFDSRAYEQADLHTLSMDRFSLQIDTQI